MSLQVLYILYMSSTAALVQTPFYTPAATSESNKELMQLLFDEHIRVSVGFLSRLHRAFAEFYKDTASKDHVHIRTLETMVSGIPLLLGLRTRI